MKSLAELTFPQELRYTVEHIWVRMDGDEAVVGISDFAQDQLGEIAFVDMPSAGEHFDAEIDFGSVESLKSVNKLYMPVSGTVSAVNSELDDTPTLANASPYENGWIIRIRPDNAAAVAALLDAENYKKHLAA